MNTTKIMTEILNLLSNAEHYERGRSDTFGDRSSGTNTPVIALAHDGKMTPLIVFPFRLSFPFLPPAATHSHVPLILVYHVHK